MRLSVVVITLAIAGCTAAGPNLSWVAELEKAGRDKEAVWLGGDPSVGHNHGIPSREEAYALVAANKGKTGSFVGYVWSVQLKGNTALVEIIPDFAGSGARNCVRRIESHRLACLAKRRGIFRSAVTCRVNNWHAVNRATGSRMFTDAQTRWQRADAWNHVVVQGKVSGIEDKAEKFGSWGGSGGSFGLGSGYRENGFVYQSIQLAPCKVLTFRGKAIANTGRGASS